MKNKIFYTLCILYIIGFTYIGVQSDAKSSGWAFIVIIDMLIASLIYINYKLGKK